MVRGAVAHYLIAPHLTGHESAHADNRRVLAVLHDLRAG